MRQLALEVAPVEEKLADRRRRKGQEALQHEERGRSSEAQQEMEWDESTLDEWRAREQLREMGCFLVSDLLGAVEEGDLSKLKRTLAHEKAIALLDNDRAKNALVNAARNGHRKCVRALIEAGANVNYAMKHQGDDWFCGRTTEVWSETPLTAAVSGRFYHTAKHLLRAGADVNIKGGCVQGFRRLIVHATPLEIAASVDSVKCVDLLLRANTSNENAINALNQATRKGHISIIDVILNKIIGLNQKILQNAIVFAVCNADYFMGANKAAKGVRHLLSAGADVNWIDPADNSGTLISQLVRGTNCWSSAPGQWWKETDPYSCQMAAAVLKMIILEAGVSVNAICDDTWTPLSLAVEHHICYSVIVGLIDAGADVSAPALSGPLISWAMCGWPRRTRVDKTKTLISAGVDVNGVDRDGHTLLWRAVTGRDKERVRVVKKVVEAGADVQGADPEIFGLGFMNVVSISKILLQHGCRVGQVRLGLSDHRSGFVRKQKRLLAKAAGAELLDAKKPVVKTRMPSNLMHLCREAISKHLMSVSDVNLFWRVPRLGLPSIMEKYLLYYVDVGNLPDSATYKGCSTCGDETYEPNSDHSSLSDF